MLKYYDPPRGFTTRRSLDPHEGSYALGNASLAVANRWFSPQQEKLHKKIR